VEDAVFDSWLTCQQLRDRSAAGIVLSFEDMLREDEAEGEASDLQVRALCSKRSRAAFFPRLSDILLCPKKAVSTQDDIHRRLARDETQYQLFGRVDLDTDLQRDAALLPRPSWLNVRWVGNIEVTICFTSAEACADFSFYFFSTTLVVTCGHRKARQRCRRRDVEPAIGMLCCVLLSVSNGSLWTV
jgi:hypothetical protein